MITIAEIIDWIGRNLDRIKTIGVLLLIGLFATSAINNGCNRSQMETMLEKVTGLNVRNDILQGDIKAMDSVLIAKEDSILRLKGEIGQSNIDICNINAKYGIIKGKYDDLASDLLKTSTQDSYEFLDTQAYPYGGEKKYSFNEPQVKAIHRTYLEHQGLIALNDNLQQQKDEFVHQIELHETLAMETSSSMAFMKENRADLEQVIENKDAIIETQDKQLKKAKRKSFLDKVLIGAGVISAFIIGAAVG